MPAQKEQFSYGYPDPSFALDLIENSSRSADCSEPSSADSNWGADYPDPSLGLLPAEEEEEEEEEMREEAYA